MCLHHFVIIGHYEHQYQINNRPGKPTLKIESKTKTTRTSVISKPKYSAIPAHTPAIILLDDRFNFFFIALKFETENLAKNRGKIIGFHKII